MKISTVDSTCSGGLGTARSSGLRQHDGCNPHRRNTQVAPSNPRRTTLRSHQDADHTERRTPRSSHGHTTRCTLGTRARHTSNTLSSTHHPCTCSCHTGCTCRPIQIGPSLYIESWRCSPSTAWRQTPGTIAPLLMLPRTLLMLPPASPRAALMHGAVPLLPACRRALGRRTSQESHPVLLK